MKQKVILQFSSIEALVAFSRQALLPYYELNSNSCILRCECTLEDIEIACSRYEARVIREPDEAARQAV